MLTWPWGRRRSIPSGLALQFCNGLWPGTGYHRVPSSSEVADSWTLSILRPPPSGRSFSVVQLPCGPSTLPSVDLGDLKRTNQGIFVTSIEYCHRIGMVQVPLPLCKMNTCEFANCWRMAKFHTLFTFQLNPSCFSKLNQIDPSTIACGLTPTEESSGLQTRWATYCKPELNYVHQGGINQARE